MSRSEEEELNYTTDMINTNFSNYSAWHNRRYELTIMHSVYTFSCYKWKGMLLICLLERSCLINIVCLQFVVFKDGTSFFGCELSLEIINIMNMFYN